MSSRPSAVSINKAKHSEINKTHTRSLKTEFDGSLFLKNVYFSENWDGGRPGRSWRTWNHNWNILYKKFIANKVILVISDVFNENLTCNYRTYYLKAQSKWITVSLITFKFVNKDVICHFKLPWKIRESYFSFYGFLFLYPL